MATELGNRVLVTGGAGFIGRRVVRALLAAGHEVTVADLRPSQDHRVRNVTGDLCDPDVAARAVTDDTVAIIHLAAITSVLQSIDDPVRVHMVNVDITGPLLEARAPALGRVVRVRLHERGHRQRGRGDHH